MKKIVIKYLNDSISNEDLERLEVWLQNPKNQIEFKELVQVNYELNSLNGKVDAEIAYQKVLKLIDHSRRSGGRRFFNFLKYAALLIGVSILGYGVYQSTIDAVKSPSVPQIVLQLEDGTTQIVNEGQNTVISNTFGKKVTEQKAHELVYASQDSTETILRYNTLKVPNGKTFGITLSDGSKVTLNAGSELRYPVQFIENEKNRMVFLNGEAYFEVTKNSKHPFIVSTKDMGVEVMGTAFNVTSYIDDYKTYTVLVEGRVAVHNKLADQDSKVLEPNQKVFFNGNQLETIPTSVDKYVAWVHGQLVFVEDSFIIIENKLERKYNVTISNTYAALNDINITATFKDETIEQVLETFQTYIPFDYSIKNGMVIIREPK